MNRVFKNEKFKVILFFAALTIILTWPSAWHFFSSVPSNGADTMQVIGVAGDRANLILEKGLFAGTLELAKRAEFNIVTLYAYFQIIFGRIVGYNILFFASFILSGFGAYLLALYFTKSKPASLIAGVIFAFSPFHIHNALGTNVGTMHQEWLPFFALYLFKFFENLSLKNFSLAALFFLLIGFTEHQTLAFTVIFILLFLAYKLVSGPKKFLRGKLWIYILVSAVIFSLVFFFMFRSLFTIAGSGNNYLDAGLKSAVKYSNDALAIFVPAPFHSFWPKAFSEIREVFKRRSDSNFSVYVGYFVLLLSLLAIFGIRFLKKRNIPTKGIFFWLAVAVGFYVISWGPYLHYKGVLDPPVKMPYWLIYQYLPFFENIRTVGRFFIWSMLGFSLLAAWGTAFAISKIKNQKSKIDENESINQDSIEQTGIFKNINYSQKIVFAIVVAFIMVEFLAVPFKTNSLLHSSFYEKLGKDRENYSVLEVPGSTSYDFASRDLVWKSIHRKNTINGYDFARVIEDHYTFQRGTPIIRTLLYDIPNGSNGNDRDIMKGSYYSISSEILNYYNIRWIILDKEGLKGHPEEGDSNLIYPAKSYVSNVIECAEEYEDEYLYACKIDQSDTPEHMFLAMDYSNKHWVGKSKSKNGLQRWAENGAGLKLVNMSGGAQKGKLKFNLKIEKPLWIKVFLNGEEIFSKYMTQIKTKHEISANIMVTKPGENDIAFGIYAADGSEIYSEKKSDTARIYQVEVE